jgi:hypothetical protein
MAPAPADSGTISHLDHGACTCWLYYNPAPVQWRLHRLILVQSRTWTMAPAPADSSTSQHQDRTIISRCRHRRLIFQLSVISVPGTVLVGLHLIVILQSRCWPLPSSPCSGTIFCSYLVAHSL